MHISRWLIVATLVGAAGGGAACTREAVDDARHEADVVLDEAERGVDGALEATAEGVDTAVDATRETGGQAADATKTLVQKTADETKEVAGAIGRTTTGIISATGEAVTDGWITTTVSAAFIDDALLKGSNINVDTQDHVVTLKGVVGSAAAKARATEIARGTRGVTRVVNQLVVT